MRRCLPLLVLLFVAAPIASQPPTPVPGRPIMVKQEYAYIYNNTKELAKITIISPFGGFTHYLKPDRYLRFAIRTSPKLRVMVAYNEKDDLVTNQTVELKGDHIYDVNYTAPAKSPSKGRKVKDAPKGTQTDYRN